jgi:hypothetical protein
MAGSACAEASDLHEIDGDVRRQQLELIAAVRLCHSLTAAIVDRLAAGAIRTEKLSGGTRSFVAPTKSDLPIPPRSGKTHGRWTSPDGDVIMLVSGKGSHYYELACRRAELLGLTRGLPGAEAAIARHVEVQFAVRMSENGLVDEVIEINRPVCGTTERDRSWGDTCDKRLPEFLPPGCRLTVMDRSSPAGRTYVGRRVSE